MKWKLAPHLFFTRQMNILLVNPFFISIWSWFVPIFNVTHVELWKPINFQVFFAISHTIFKLESWKLDSYVINYSNCNFFVFFDFFYSVQWCGNVANFFVSHCSIPSHTTLHHTFFAQKGHHTRTAPEGGTLLICLDPNFQEKSHTLLPQTLLKENTNPKGTRN